MKLLYELKRVKYRDLSIYIHPNIPYYFIPNNAGDKFLQNILKNKDIYSSLKILNLSLSKSAIAVENFLNYIKERLNSNNKVYKGRKNYINFDFPKEVWFHITNRCNLNCSHCLFSETLNNNKELDKDFIINLVKELNYKGTNIFIFTGGEPLLHKDFPEIIKFILKNNSLNKIAILTNGLLIEEFYNKIKNFADFERIHFQISCEGTDDKFFNIRKFPYKKFQEIINFLLEKNINFALAIDIFSDNFEYSDFKKLIDIGVKNFHFFYHIPYGNGKNYKIDLDFLIEKLIEFYKLAKVKEINIDNFYSLETQIFTYPSIKHDLTSSCIESIAIGADYNVYPTAATVYQDKLVCGNLKKDSIFNIWKYCELINKIRNTSVIDFPHLKDDEFKFFHGGGDLDLSFFYSKKIYGYDPFIKLYNEIFKFLIYENAAKFKNQKEYPEIIFEQGDKIKDCGKKGEVFLTHSNCLLTFATKKGIEPVQNFYKNAAIEENRDILNPFLDNLKSSDIPEENLNKSYGCGSPVNFAHIKSGDFVLDIGSGSGVETLLASNIVGDNGLVVGIDMLDEMLKLSNNAKKSKNKKNLYYIKSFIENIPFKDNSFDVVISNCVINLSNEKRNVFSEIFRILKEGGRFVISDVISEQELPIDFLLDDKLKGECLSGSFTEDRLFNMLKSLGFKNIKVISRVLYRIERGFRFFSLTFSAEKPKNLEMLIYYPGEFSAIVTDDYQILQKGKIIKAKDIADEDIFILDNDKATVKNVEMISCCNVAPEIHHETGCLLCGEPLVYSQIPIEKKCEICGKTFSTNSYCAQGHFICDNCHQKPPLILMNKYFFESEEKDLIKLFVNIKEKAKFPMHGPEYHAMVPGVILKCFQNNGGNISDMEIKMGIERGKKIPGGSCGFMGTCGVGTGVGIAVSVIIKSTPLKKDERSIVLKINSELLNKFAKYNGARCCQRESITALKYFSKISKEITGIHIPADFNYTCTQSLLNKDCIGKRCFLYNRKIKGR